MEVRAIRENEREECLALWNTVFGDGDAYFRRYFEGDVEWLPYYTQVCVEDSKLVSAVHVCKRTVACGEFHLTMGGIANVATLKEYRGRGYNTACLQAAIGVMEADAMDFSLLFTGIPPYYAKQGFASCSIPSLDGVLRPDFTPTSTPYTVRDATGDDFPAIQTLYDAYNRTRPIAVQRYPAYWRDWLHLTPEKLAASFLICVGNSIGFFGYIAYESSEEEQYVTELAVGGAEGERQEIVCSLLSAVAQKCEGEEKRIALSIPFDADVRAICDNLFASQEWQPNEGCMARLLHPDNLFKSFVMEWNERWRNAGRPSGVLDFATPYGITRLDANGPTLRVEAVASDSVNPSGEILSQTAFFNLLFGIASPEQVTPNADLHPLLSALFPPHAPVYWNADGF